MANTVRTQFPESWDGGLKIASKQILSCGDRTLWLPLELRHAPRRRWWCHPHRRDHRRWDTYPRELPRASTGLGQRRTPTHLLGLGYLWSSGCTRTEPVVGAKPHKTVVAVATVVLFGTLSMFGYPLLYRAGLLDALSPQAVGVYTGIYHTRGRTRRPVRELR